MRTSVRELRQEARESDSIKDKLRRLAFEATGVETDDFLGTLPKLTLEPAAASPGLGAEAVSAGAVTGRYRLVRPPEHRAPVRRRSR